MILDQFGNLARRRTIPMQAQHVRCLVDGRFFIRHVGDVLASLRLEPYCRSCVLRGHSGAVTLSRGENQVQFRCDHAAGHVRTDKSSEVEPLLHTLDWGLRCMDCQTDAVGDNHKRSQIFTVNCACTSRELVNPMAQTAAAPAVSSLESR